ncbi:MAG: TetR/AcrR family transcriptional regulator [Pseudomonadota bacterium]|jgi:AcrR family transcriptional regulator
MTRVRANDYDDKRNAILGKAATLIARKGFDVATMMDVAQACGTSKSHLYHYFPSKEDLLYAIVHEHITQQAADLVRIVHLPLPAEERFALFIDSFVQGAARSRDEHIMLMNDLKFLPRGQREHVRKLEVEMTSLLEGLLREINPGLMAQEKLETPYALLLYGMMIWTFTWYRRNGAIAPAELAQRISDLFINGFRHADPAPGTEPAAAASA